MASRPNHLNSRMEFGRVFACRARANPLLPPLQGHPGSCHSGTQERLSRLDETLVTESNSSRSMGSPQRQCVVSMDHRQNAPCEKCIFLVHLRTSVASLGCMQIQSWNSFRNWLPPLTRFDLWSSVDTDNPHRHLHMNQKEGRFRQVNGLPVGCVLLPILPPSQKAYRALLGSPWLWRGLHGNLRAIPQESILRSRLSTYGTMRGRDRPQGLCHTSWCRSVVSVQHVVGRAANLKSRMWDRCNQGHNRTFL